MPVQLHSASATPTTAPPWLRLPRLRSRAMWLSGGISLPLQRFQRGHTQRHADAEVRPGNFAIDDFHGAMVHIDELVHHRQPDTGAAYVATGRAPGIEGIEDAGAVLVRNAGTAVTHLQHQLLAAG